MILVRADANEKIGTGHVMRCLSIADAFAQIGHRIVFITADHRGDGLIKDRGFECVCLDSDWTQMDNEGTDRVVKGYNPELLLIDSYHVTERYTEKLSKIVKVAYIDDLNTKNLTVDFLINYNIFARSADYSCYLKTRTKLVLSPQYAPLRGEFKNISKHKVKSVTDILISAGGADPESVSERIMTEICPEMKRIRFHFVIGALNPRMDIIKALVAENVILHIDERNMSGLMQYCDIAISAAGSTLYELCACGTPTITYTLADNQFMVARMFETQDIMINAGDCRKNECFVRQLKEIIKFLISDSKKRRLLSERMQTLVDGMGAERLVRVLDNNASEQAT